MGGATMTRPASPRPWRIAAAAGVAAISAGAAVLYVSVGNPTAAKPDTTRWVAPVTRTIDSVITASGTVRLKNGAEVRVGAQQSGIVMKLNVSVGSHVEKGDIIAEIDSRAVKARIAQAKAQLGHDQIALAKAERDAERAVRLAESGSVPRLQAEDAKATLDLARATVDASTRALETASVDLNYTTIKAPITGTISSVATQQGETVAASFATPTFVTIIEDNALEVVAMVDETDIGGIKPGQPATFTTLTYPDREFTGTVARIAPVATIVSGVVNYEVAVAIAGKAESLRPDMTTNVVIRTGSRTGLYIPSAAIHKGDGTSSVVIRSADGQARTVQVVTEGRRGDEVGVLRGIAPSDQIQVKEQP
jgi:RND family efflux transporter MFP subunit